jgi:hypothetical protein
LVVRSGTAVTADAEVALKSADLVQTTPKRLLSSYAPGLSIGPEWTTVTMPIQDSVGTPTATTCVDVQRLLEINLGFARRPEIPVCGVLDVAEVGFF